MIKKQSCPVECSPSDWSASGLCGKNGCYAIGIIAIKDTSVKQSGNVGIQPQGIAEGLYTSVSEGLCPKKVTPSQIAGNRSLVASPMPLSTLCRLLTTGFIVVRRFQKSLFLEILCFWQSDRLGLLLCNKSQVTRLTNI